MNDREYRAQIKRIKPLIEKWKSNLGLHIWDIDHKFHQGAFVDADDTQSLSPAVAQAVADYRYLHGRVDWNMAEVEDSDDVTLERQVIHEYLHFATDCLKRYARSDGVIISMAEVERSVTELALAVQWAYRDGLNDGKKGVSGIAKKRKGKG